jgi:serine/threonine protein kinase
MTVWEAGRDLGPYALVAAIGVGGMGEVWKARDTRLDRVVAIERLTAQHRERVEREARTVASPRGHVIWMYGASGNYSHEREMPVADTRTDAISRRCVHRLFPVGRSPGPFQCPTLSL